MGHEKPVEPGRQVQILIHEGNIAPRHAGSRHRNPAQQNPVAHQRRRQRRHLGPHPLVPQIKQTHRQVADRNPLQDPINPQVVELEERKPVHHNPQQKQDSRPPRRVPGQLRPRRPASQPRLKRKHDRRPRHKHKRGKHHVGRRQPIPRGVVHKAPRPGPAVVVHHDHEGDGDAAQHVQREQPLHGRGSNVWVGHGGSVLRLCRLRRRPIPYALGACFANPARQACRLSPLHCYTPFQRIPARPLALTWRLSVPDVQPPVFQPFVSPGENRPEFTLRAVLLGSFFGIMFGAVTVYVGLRAGLTVAASIPIAVLSISILRAFGRSSILENVIVQTTGNAGQSIAAGVIFTLPALIFLGFDLEYSRIFMLALIGGFLGVLFMVPLRRDLIVEEHGKLKFPEGTACADVLIAGEKGGSFASRVFFGLGLGALYTFFQNENLFGAWPGTPEFQPDFGPQHVLKGASIKADATPEYLGVGYIIGPKTAGIIFAGGVFSWLVLMPLIYFFGKNLPTPIYPGTVPVEQMGPSDMWKTYIRPIGAGAVAAAGVIALLKTMPTIIGALTSGFKNMRGSKEAKAEPIRTEKDFSMGTAMIGL